MKHSGTPQNGTAEQQIAAAREAVYGAPMPTTAATIRVRRVQIVTAKGERVEVAPQIAALLRAKGVRA